MTKERPILFSGAMVRAILDGRKTQTRRVMKPQPTIEGMWHCLPKYSASSEQAFREGAPYFGSCPYGRPGDRLWVRETWQHSNHPFGPYEPDCDVFYRADYLDDPLGPDLERSTDGIRRQWRPSIHMPRSAARILLKVDTVRVERLNECSASDAAAEGLHFDDSVPFNGPWFISPGDAQGYADATLAYRGLWDDINGAGAWEANPYVWVVEFQRV
ncbi:hypothetical protein [Cupriavidus metallidurans]|uniref:hypothetical protein n=1 Tax=Cupriavidus metallidurans TaxID=119219 RepID=UPI000CE003D1|nr:hypothetical protein [Cupriavidus metallidurans]AVA32978.1 hypothetical protein C3Z06_04650 [Cupriavidus metallidurans]